jgi:sporulation protein YlmC with PRC-barrel domain
MPHYGTLQNYKFEDVQEVRGTEVYGVNNEKLGTVDDVIFEHATGELRYVVVDTGGWLSSKKFLVPMGRIQPYGNREDKFYAELDKESIQMLPEFNADALKSAGTWADYEKRYHERWNEGAVMYNKDTGRIVTPPVDQVPGGRTKPLSEEGRRSLMRDFTPQKMGRQDEPLGVAPSGDDVTLHPQKPSMAGREDVLLQQESAHSKHATADTTATTAAGSHPPAQPGLQEPGVYILDRVPETEKKSDLNESLNANCGRRWIDFQQKLREGRDKVVSDCPLCGTQDKAA